jgi:Secretion system C-terminal sorting domain
LNYEIYKQRLFLLNYLKFIIHHSLNMLSKFFIIIFNSMKNNIWKVSISLLAFWQLNTALDPTNPPAGVTGAPTEATCSTAAGCHSGGTYTGTVVLTGIPDTIRPNTTYTLTLTGTIAAAINTGFELTCLDGNNAVCGTLTAGTGSGVTSLSGRSYIRNSARKSFAAGAAAWTFTWKSPATLANPNVTFYFVVMAANNNGGTSGDNAVSGTKRVLFQTLSPVQESESTPILTVFPNPTTQILNVKADNYAGQAEVAVMNTQGQLVHYQSFMGEKALDLSALPKGQYLVQVKMGEKSVLQKVLLK